jgi:hypothetical protein
MEVNAYVSGKHVASTLKVTQNGVKVSTLSYVSLWPNFFQLYCITEYITHSILLYHYKITRYTYRKDWGIVFFWNVRTTCDSLRSLHIDFGT